MGPQKHSRLGIASFITSILSGVMIILVILIAAVVEASVPGGMDEESIGAVMIGLFFILFLGTSIVALGLGIAGLIQADRKKLFAVLGTVFASAVFLSTILFIFLSILVVAVG